MHCATFWNKNPIWSLMRGGGRFCISLTRTGLLYPFMYGNFFSDMKTKMISPPLMTSDFIFSSWSFFPILISTLDFFLLNSIDLTWFGLIWYNAEQTRRIGHFRFFFYLYLDIYVSINLSNQAICILSENFSQFGKCL